MAAPKSPILLLLLLCGFADSAYGGEPVTLIAPIGVRAALQDMFPAFERETGYTVNATFGSGLTTKKQIAQGEVFDVSIAQPPFPEILASGNVVIDSQIPIASVSVAVAVRKGQPKPDIATPDAVKRMLLSAKAISFPAPSFGAAAGVSFEKTLEKLGIAKQVEAKLVRTQGGYAAMKLLADGKVDIGLTFRSEMSDPGINAVGPLPEEISPPTKLIGFVSAHSKNPGAAKALLAFIHSAQVRESYQKNGMQPGNP
ncbi:MAG TPA: substrate-binding domain-containing protein [Rhizomicrobium sp.]|jgi:molybdate transport system substrate-binding protein